MNPPLTAAEHLAAVIDSFDVAEAARRAHAQAHRQVAAGELKPIELAAAAGRAAATGRAFRQALDRAAAFLNRKEGAAA